ncbi:hypothetical protein [Bacillus benzoevorans]|uniref:Uncharacterized protein n=1 Tax=Bacillus benzoevorans TaxID=1456 RepID=A0A7X0HU00_9BACI|nr:hypothetical protein [Bacillus benzoevorans]
MPVGKRGGGSCVSLKNSNHDWFSMLAAGQNLSNRPFLAFIIVGMLKLKQGSSSAAPLIFTREKDLSR